VSSRSSIAVRALALLTGGMLLLDRLRQLDVHIRTREAVLASVLSLLLVVSFRSVYWYHGSLQPAGTASICARSSSSAPTTRLTLDQPGSRRTRNSACRWSVAL
jgi:hypothetical protein